jgi:hypothetical protein
MMLSKRLAVTALAGLFATTGRAMAAAGVPIQGAPIGLDQDPGGNLVAEARTDGRGTASFDRLAVGRYVLFVPDLARFQGPMVFSASLNGGPAIVSAPMRPRAGRAYAMEANAPSRRLVLTVDKANSRLAVSIFDRWGNL